METKEHTKCRHTSKYKDDDGYENLGMQDMLKNV